MENAVLQMEHISKSFATVAVLKDINLSIQRGHVVTLVGENGAGKSTLCKIIAGNLMPDTGTLTIDGRTYESLDIDQAKRLGIRMVHQELLVLPKMTIQENLFIGSELSAGLFLDKAQMDRRARELLELVGLSVDPETKVSEIDIAAKQLVEIARALSADAGIIILDEPTSSLSDKEIDKLFAVVNRLKERGVTFIFVSHRMKEVLRISDEIFVLKDGELVTELDAREATEELIVKHMVGRNYDDYYHRKRTFFGAEAMRLENVGGVEDKESRGAYTPRGVSLSLYEGEVLGIAGLVGAGRTELIRLIFGEDEKAPGSRVFIFGKEARIRSSKDAMRQGLAWVTEDRKSEGLILKFPISDNIALPNLGRLTPKLFVDRKKERELCETFIKSLSIRTTGTGQRAMYLSGGNQQKVVLAKWLATQPKILILDEPTRGIDVAAKAEGYKLINELSAQGIAILLISSETPEIMGMSDRILVMHEGTITGEFAREEFSEEGIIAAAIGRKKPS